MHVIRSCSEAAKATDLHGGAITVGNFDGVHLGHEQVLAETRGHALDVGGPAVAVTFEPHPRAVLYPEEAPRRLGRLHERLELLGKSGIDGTLLLHFNREIAEWPADEFVRRLHKSFRFKHIHVGYDFAFGHNRAGNVEVLRKLGEELGFTVTEASAFELQGAVVSSSRIRSAIEAADFRLVESLLGRPYTISGHIGHGEKRGREMGFPTANIDVEDLAHPPVGIYAVTAESDDGRTWDGAAYLGYRPTFNGRTLLLETHLFDDSPDLYKHRLTVTFVERVREDRAFKGAEDLAQQIADDCDKAREILARHRKQG
jgi:riboflavin kinase/FMN adenylyltransferase